MTFECDNGVEHSKNDEYEEEKIWIVIGQIGIRLSLSIDVLHLAANVLSSICRRHPSANRPYWRPHTLIRIRLTNEKIKTERSAELLQFFFGIQLQQRWRSTYKTEMNASAWEKLRALVFRKFKINVSNHVLSKWSFSRRPSFLNTELELLWIKSLCLSGKLFSKNLLPRRARIECSGTCGNAWWWRWWTSLSVWSETDLTLRRMEERKKKVQKKIWKMEKKWFRGNF